MSMLNSQQQYAAAPAGNFNPHYVPQGGYAPPQSQFTPPPPAQVYAPPFDPQVQFAPQVAPAGYGHQQQQAPPPQQYQQPAQQQYQQAPPQAPQQYGNQAPIQFQQHAPTCALGHKNSCSFEGQVCPNQKMPSGFSYKPGQQGGMSSNLSVNVKLRQETQTQQNGVKIKISYVRLNVWGRQADALAQTLQPGMVIEFVAEFGINSFTDKRTNQRVSFPEFTLARGQNNQPTYTIKGFAVCDPNEKSTPKQPYNGGGGGYQQQAPQQQYQQQAPPQQQFQQQAPPAQQQAPYQPQGGPPPQQQFAPPVQQQQQYAPPAQPQQQFSPPPTQQFQQQAPPAQQQYASSGGPAIDQSDIPF